MAKSGLDKLHSKTIQCNLVYLISQRKHCTIRQLCIVTGLHRKTITAILKGKGNPTLHTINILSAYFKVDILQPILIIIADGGAV
ncbi:MAG: helix-turn-helix domain-containing protein [Acidiferrobacterales bacterium]